MEPAAPPIPPELLERFRTIGLRLDRDGRFWHQGAPVEHARLRQALLRWLDVRDEDGRDLVRLDGDRYAYVEIEDTHLRVTAARWRGDRLELVLDDGSEEELAYPTLTVGADGALRCRVRGGRLTARFTTAAQQVAVERLDVERDDAAAGDRHVLVAAGRRWPIAGGTALTPAT
ncbi:MAG TPA: hypothetical protein VHE35_02830 [Kofleriaceae bacterium]|nr:hypothetical protein [Kofleriaceae bacterium]